MRPGDTPVPIPNTMVKTWSADGTILETVWESRWMPLHFSLDESERSEAWILVKKYTSSSEARWWCYNTGGVAQLGEHLPCKQGVKSSNLSISTVKAKALTTNVPWKLHTKREII